MARGDPVRQMALRAFHLDHGRRLATTGGREMLASPRETEPEWIGDLAVSDLSGSPRRGLHGPDAPSVLRRAGCDLPEHALNAALQKDGSLVCRLGDLDFLAIANASAPASAPLAAGAVVETPGCYDTGHDEKMVDFLIAGVRARLLLSHVTALDLRPHVFPDLAIALTLALSLQALIVRWDLGGIPAFRLFIDAASATGFAEEIDRLLGVLGGIFVGAPALTAGAGQVLL